LNAQLVAEAIAEQLKKRASFRRVIKMRVESTKQAGAKGIRLQISGRLGGAEIARTEEIKQGRVPLHTFRMDIDYANVFALTVYGKIGIKVWICKGEILTKRDLNPNFVGGKSEVSDRRDRREFDRRDDRRDHDRRDRRDDRRGGGGGGNRGGSGGGNRSGGSGNRGGGARRN